MSCGVILLNLEPWNDLWQYFTEACNSFLTISLLPAWFPHSLFSPSSQSDLGKTESKSSYSSVQEHIGATQRKSQTPYNCLSDLMIWRSSYLAELILCSPPFSLLPSQIGFWLSSAPTKHTYTVPSPMSVLSSRWPNFLISSSLGQKFTFSKRPTVLPLQLLIPLYCFQSTYHLIMYYVIYLLIMFIVHFLFLLGRT